MIFASSAAGLLALTACHGAFDKMGESAVGAAQNWADHGGGQDDSGYSRLDAISSDNVGRLGLAWALDLPGEASLEATPLEVDGVLYFTGSYSSIYAVDGKTGKLLWTYDPQECCHNPIKGRYTMPVNRGPAYADGRVFAGTDDGRLIAVDAKTGKMIWSVETVDKDSFHTSTGAPRVFNGKVIIGNGGADFGARGYVTAYDAATGKQIWRFYTAPGSPEQNKGDAAMEAAAKTWGKGEYWKTGTGGTVWNGITFDPDMNRVYIGTGNAGPYDPVVRDPGGGDDLYLASIVALDADTGKYIWHYQVNPREAWDYKATANMIDATLPIDGKPTKVLMQAPTNGFFYVLNRTTGKLISADKIGKVNWADHIDVKTGRPVEAPNIRYETGDTILYPSNMGAHNWQAMSFSPKTGLVYIPYMQLGVHFHKGPVGKGQVSYGGLSISYDTRQPGDATGALLAWDPVAQKVRWSVPRKEMWNGGTMATAGNLVFQGTADGYFSAYDAATGKQLWRFYAGLGIIAPPITYAIGGKQYVSVLVGFGGSAGIMSEVLAAGWKFSAPRRLLTFALDGKARLGPTPPRFAPLQPLDDPGLKLKDEDVLAGQVTFMTHCAVCHGFDANSAGGPAPDLRESQIALQSDGLWSVLHDGALRQAGMPQFGELTRPQVSQVHAYIRAKAREALGLRKAVSAPTGTAAKL